MDAETYTGTGDPLLDGIFMTLTMMFRAVMIVGLLAFAAVAVALLLENLDLLPAAPRKKTRREIVDKGGYFKSRVVWSDGKPVGRVDRYRVKN